MKVSVEIPTSMMRKIEMLKGNKSIAAYVFSSLQMKIDSDYRSQNTSATNRGELQDEAEEQGMPDFKSV